MEYSRFTAIKLDLSIVSTCNNCSTRTCRVPYLKFFVAAEHWKTMEGISGLQRKHRLHISCKDFVFDA